jgi:hypothetical protein
MRVVRRLTTSRSALAVLNRMEVHLAAGTHAVMVVRRPV